MSGGLANDRNLEKQMGCMAGFLQIFDRHQILSGKRSYSTKRLPPSHVVDTTSESEKSAPQSPAVSKELGKPKQAAAPSPDRSKRSPPAELRSPLAAAVPELPPKSPLNLQIFEMKEGRRSWKFGKEAPRLSLDSRATTDAKGGLHPKEIRTAAASIIATANRCESISSDATDESQQHRSPSVIARLMGLEPLPDSSTSEPEKKPELRRSVSESRVSRDLFHSRFITEGSNFSSKHQTQSQSAYFNSVLNENPQLDAQFVDPRNYLQNNAIKVEPLKGFNRSYNSSSPWKAPQHRKSFIDSGDFFPEPKQTVSIYSEIENKLKLRGIDEPSKDLNTLKQILEALQLKGLLHSRKQCEQNLLSHRNFVYDDSPIVVMKPSRSPISRRTANDYTASTGGNQRRGPRRNYGTAAEHSPSISPRSDRNLRSPNRTGRSPSPTTPNRSESGNAMGKRCNSLVKPKQLSVETHRKLNESTENRRVSPVHSPKLNLRRTGAGPTVNNTSPRNKKPTAETHRKDKKTTIIGSTEDESSSISGSSITTSTDTERSKTEEFKEGRNLLERCDKLLHSIAEMTAADMQPSPVSVLDSSFYKDESSTPSPVTTRRNIDFKDYSGELEEEMWSPVISPFRSIKEISDDCDFVYITDILRASHYLPEDSDVFLLLEKQQYLKGKDICKVSRLQRKLVFDTIHEILDRNQRLPPWKAALWTNGDVTKPSLDKIWLEFQRIRENEVGENLFETICGVLKKDLAGDGVTGWGDCPVEMSEVILDIERLVFKDLIGEMIRDLAELASRNTCSSMMPRRKLVF